MNDDAASTVLTAACFRLGMFGARITQTFADRVEQIGLTHKQVGVLAVVDAGLARSQREIATRLQIAPSLVVSLVDQLIKLGAVSRSRSTSDRRVQVIKLTKRGKELLAASASITAELDAALRTSLSESGEAALDALLHDVDAEHPAINTTP